MLLPPINYIFKLLQSRAKVSIWLYEQLGIRIEGTIRVRARAHARNNSQSYDLLMHVHRDSTSS